MSAAAARCPHCQAEFSADDVRKAVAQNVQGILFAVVAVAVLLAVIMWWQGRKDAAMAEHLKGIEQGTIDPLKDGPPS